jgi:hypothetical protein
MALDLSLLGLVVNDTARSLTFYRRLGVAIPQRSDDETHVQVQMGSRLTCFLHAIPTRWEPRFPAAQM